MTALRIGIGLPGADGAPHGGRVAEAARWIEEAGLDAIGVSEVLIGDGTPALEPVVTLATAAAVTQRVHLDFGVLAASARPAAMLAAQVQTLQHLSGGRVRLGLGIGGFVASPFWAALDAPTTGRGRAFDALLEVLPGLISGTPTTRPDRDRTHRGDAGARGAGAADPGGRQRPRGGAAPDSPVRRRVAAVRDVPGAARGRRGPVA